MVNYKESHSFSSKNKNYLYNSIFFCNFAAFFVMRCFKTMIKTMQKTPENARFLQKLLNCFTIKHHTNT